MRIGVERDEQVGLGRARHVDPLAQRHEVVVGRGSARPGSGRSPRAWRLQLAWPWSRLTSFSACRRRRWRRDRCRHGRGRARSWGCGRRRRPPAWSGGGTAGTVTPATSRAASHRLATSESSGWRRRQRPVGSGGRCPGRVGNCDGFGRGDLDGQRRPPSCDPPWRRWRPSERAAAGAGSGFGASRWSPAISDCSLMAAAIAIRPPDCRSTKMRAGPIPPPAALATADARGLRELEDHAARRRRLLFDANRLDQPLPAGGRRRSGGIRRRRAR